MLTLSLPLPPVLPIEGAALCQWFRSSRSKMFHFYWRNSQQQNYFCLVTEMFSFHWLWRLKPAYHTGPLANWAINLSKATSGLVPTHLHFPLSRLRQLCHLSAPPSGYALPFPWIGQWGLLLIYRPGSLLLTGKTRAWFLHSAIG